MTAKQFHDELISDSDLSKITFADFGKMLKDSEVCSELAGSLSIHLHQKFAMNLDFEVIKDMIQYIDKSLFVNLREGRVTLVQLKARVAEKRGFAKYKVLDDVYPDISPEEMKKIRGKTQWAEFLFGPNPKAEDYSRKLEPW